MFSSEGPYQHSYTWVGSERKTTNGKIKQPRDWFQLSTKWKSSISFNGLIPSWCQTMDFLSVLKNSLISVLSRQFSLSVCISHFFSVKGNMLLNWINDPKDSSGLQSGPGRHPNHSFERFSIRFHIGPVRGPQGWSPGAECPQGSFQITSFTQVKGRITHSSHWSAQDPATWVSYHREKRYGAGQRGLSNLANQTLQIQDLLLLPCTPTGVLFLLLCFFFTGSVQSC